MTNLKYVCFGLLVSTHSHAQDLARIQTEIQHFVPNKFMGSVLVARGEEVLFSENFGFSNIVERDEVSESSIFRIASITKQFTSASILLLEQQGKLSLEDSVAEYVQNLPQNLERVTIFHLLTHTSGIAEGIPNEAFNSNGDKLLELNANQLARIQLGSEPGETQQYSNAGYHLLGEVIESVSGITYKEFVAKNILEPLGLQQTGFLSSFSDSQANGYVLRDGALVVQSILDSEITGVASAGGMVSTATDLLTWTSALFNYSILSQTALAKMTTPYKANYALGLLIQEENERLRIYHTGSLYGASASVSYYPDTSLSIIVLSNVNERDGGGDAELIAKSIEYIVFEDDVMLPSEMKAAEVPVEVMRAYIGSYEMNGVLAFTISLENQQLQIQFEGNSNIQPFTPFSESIFYSNYPFIHYEFLPSVSDNPLRVSLHQRGSVFTFSRI